MAVWGAVCFLNYKYIFFKVGYIKCYIWGAKILSHALNQTSRHLLTCNSTKVLLSGYKYWTRSDLCGLRYTRRLPSLYYLQIHLICGVWTKFVTLYFVKGGWGVTVQRINRGIKSTHTHKYFMKTGGVFMGVFAQLWRPQVGMWGRMGEWSLL